MRTVFYLTAPLLIGTAAIGQIQIPQTPQFATMQPVNSSTNAYQQYQQPQPIRMGGTAQDVLNQSNSRAINATIQQKQQEVQQLIGQIRSDEQRSARNTPRNVIDTSYMNGFWAALSHLNNMLSGASPLSVKDAYYTVESAYGNSYLSSQEYNEIIRQSIDFIKTWMKQNALDPHDNYMVQYAIQKFMSEPLTITKTLSQGDNAPKLSAVTHQPFYYDYNDYQGEKDFRNFFLTKCLATGFGQCSSMPAVYLILAEGLSVKAYLSLAPQHSFVKFPDNDGYILNYEPTSNWQISDTWYKDNLFISPRAIANGVYLDTLNSKQVVANCVADLAVEFIKVDRTLNEYFLFACLDAGKRNFPKDNNLQFVFIYGMHLKTMLREAMRQNGITNTDDIEKFPAVKKWYKQYLDNEAYITQLGYQDMPAGMYDEMLKQQEFKGRVQQTLNVSGKEKRNLFVKTDQ